MPDYKQTAITGTAWQRAWRVECENPLEGNRAITFHEETVVNAAGQTIRTPAGSVAVPFTLANALTPFPLLDPETGLQLGTATYAQVYRMLHSLYIHAAQARDAQLLAQETPDEPAE